MACLSVFPIAAFAATLEIGYVEIEDDLRYDQTLAYAGLMLKPGGRPFGGAKLAVSDGAFQGKTVGLDFRLYRQTAKDGKGLVTLVEKLRRDRNIQIFLVDAPAAAVDELAQATRLKDFVLFNVSAQEDDLRGRACQAHLFHTIPSDAMLADALAQFLAAKKWRKVLVLQGPATGDEVMVAAFARAAKRFGVEIIDRRPFVLSNDPREREANNIALLTGDADYDVVLTADSDGEFGRSVPYQILKPRPVVGTSGLSALAWHWSWERNGAPQLTRRFDRQESRRMQSTDWAAWIAARAVMDAAVRSGSVEVTDILKFLRSDQLALDGFKGPALNFRAWDNQLRQPIFLASDNWVAASAPLSGFLHASHTLDSLGVDKPESSCRF
jgi:ABC transporter substrate binding protein (PQQ-dependent alcohol dehydrogenase system)